MSPVAAYLVITAARGVKAIIVTECTTREENAILHCQGMLVNRPYDCRQRRPEMLEPTGAYHMLAHLVKPGTFFESMDLQPRGLD